jgi:hypothetical protein
MNRSKLWSRSGLAALALFGGGTLGLLAACSSDEGNATPSNPIINTGGSGGNGGGAGDSSEAGTADQGGNANGGSTLTGDAGEAGQGGAAGNNAAGDGPGNGGASAVCPTTDLGFLNQTSTSQSSTFDNAERLGTFSTLPALQ